MNDGIDAVLGDDRARKFAVAGIALIERHAVGDRPAKAGRQIVEHDHVGAGVQQFVNHVAADIAGAAGDQNSHELMSPSE